jgi:hypothetical protein
MPTLALLLFLGVALLNTSVGKETQANESAAGVSNTNVLSESRDESSPVAPLILWQFTRRIVEVFTAAVNDPSFIEYAKEQGIDTRNFRITLSRGAETTTPTNQ